MFLGLFATALASPALTRKPSSTRSMPGSWPMCHRISRPKTSNAARFTAN